MRVLAVSPHFPPVNAPDHGRLRMMLPHAAECGWEVDVLAVDPRDAHAPVDPLLEAMLPPGVVVERRRAISKEAGARVGCSTLGLRCLPGLWAGMRAMMRRARRECRPYDLVFFTTTQFAVLVLGPLGRSAWGVPYLVDYQDPWRNDYYRRTGTEPPGGRLKYGLASLQARLLEPIVARAASGFVSVSPSYPKAIRRMNRGALGKPFLVLPFGAPEGDLDAAKEAGARQSLFGKQDGVLDLVSIGRGGDDLRPALEALFGGLARLSDEDRSRLRLHFIGTSYAPAGQGRATILPVARERGVADVVQEHPDRVAYSTALACMADADALLLCGSDDPSYNASKAHPLVSSGKPVLGVAHRRSPALALLMANDQCRAVPLPRPGQAAAAEEACARALRELLAGDLARTEPTRRGVLTARRMTERLVQFVEQRLGIGG